MRGRGSFEVPEWGHIMAIWEGDKLLHLSLASSSGSLPSSGPADPLFAEVKRQVTDYLNGRLRCLDLPYTLPEQPYFCHKLWRAAQNIPYGETVSYGGLAAWAGNPRAARAAGTAMSTNQLFLIVPCHRVIAAGGKLGGYGGRPDLKARLLMLEGLTVRQGKVLKEKPLL